MPNLYYAMPSDAKRTSMPSERTIYYLVGRFSGCIDCFGQDHVLNYDPMV